MFAYTCLILYTLQYYPNFLKRPDCNYHQRRHCNEKIKLVKYYDIFWIRLYLLRTALPPAAIGARERSCLKLPERIDRTHHCTKKTDEGFTDETHFFCICELDGLRICLFFRRIFNRFSLESELRIYVSLFLLLLRLWKKLRICLFSRFLRQLQLVF